MQIWASSWSPSDWEILFNVIYIGIGFFIGTIPLALYRPGSRLLDLICAIMLILGASLLFGLYSESRDIFLAARDLKPDDEVVRTNLSQTLYILALVVPAVMLGVAANLITAFLFAGPPLKRNRDKTPNP
jgi:hypothetical protein